MGCIMVAGRFQIGCVTVGGRSPVGCVLVVGRSFLDVTSQRCRNGNGSLHNDVVAMSLHLNQNVTLWQRRYNVILFAGT